jgi:adenylate cyclase
MNMGEFEQADKDFDRAIALVESRPPAPVEADGLFLLTSHFARVQVSALWAENLWYLGYPDRALDRVRRATAATRKSGSKEALETVHMFGGFVCHLLGDVDGLRDRAEATGELAAESGNRFRRSMSQILLGWTEVTANDFHTGITRIRDNLAEYGAGGACIRVSHFLALIAAALGKSGKPGEGLREIEESLAVIERTGERVYEAEVYRVRGELLLAQAASNASHAEQSFGTAIEISRKQHAKSWELRATTSLARILSNTNRRDEARVMLADVYNWFTEGFDTADLKDAKALLDELSG